MSIIDRLTEEHNQILIFLDTFEKDILNLMEDNIFDKNNFLGHIQFIHEYADCRHHQREEKILFKYMEEHLGLPAQKLIRHGMLVEHNLARYYVQELEKCIHNYFSTPSPQIKLNIIGLGYAYCDLLRRHIEKENNVVYPFALRQLSKEIFEQMKQEDTQFLSNEI